MTSGNEVTTAGWSERVETAKQIRRFLVIGFSSVATDLTVYVLLTAAGLGPAPAKAISYLCGVVVGFIGNKFWTFESARRSVAEPVTYLVLYTVTLAVNVLINSGVLHLAGPYLSGSYRKGCAFLVATAVTTVLNFLGMRFITFRAGIRDRREDSTRAEEEGSP